MQLQEAGGHHLTRAEKSHSRVFEEPEGQDMSVSAPSESQVDTRVDATPAASPRTPEPEYHLTFVDSPLAPVSLFRQIWQSLHEPKSTIPKQYYRGKVALPATDMRPWILDIPNEIRALFEKPQANVPKEYYRGEVDLPATDMHSWILDLPNQIRGLFEKPKAPSIPITSKPVDVPEIWQDYQPQSGSWMNSLLVHLVGIAVILLPFLVAHITQPPKASAKSTVIDISPYLAELEAAGKKAGGGGGGGDRSPTPASKGVVPRFSKTQITPPLAVIRNPHPILAVVPTLLGPPDLKLPQMNSNMPNWGDPQGVPGPPSNGPGTGGGIGSGEGTGIGPGTGGGLGPGAGGGTGGGIYSVGGGVSAPIPIYKPDPPYSEEARKAKYQGTVVLLIVVDDKGNVTDCRVVRPLGLGLDEKAEETVRTWKFKPALRNMAPVPVRVIVEVSFRLF
jgi:TonB family protein